MIQSVAKSTRERHVLAGIVVVAVVVTVATALHPGVHLALELPGLHMVIETLTAAASLGLCTIFFGRFSVSDRTAYLVLAAGFGVGGLGDFLMSTLPHSLVDHPTDVFTSWAPMGSRLFLAASLAWFALAPKGTTLPGLRSPRSGLLTIAGVLAVIATTTALLVRWLPTPVDPTLTPDASSRPFVGGHPAATAIYAVGLVLFGLAAIGFERRHLRSGDRLMLWLSASTALLATAWADYVMFPSIYLHYFYLGDAIRLVSTGVLLVGVMDEFRDHWRAKYAANTVEERRRIANELHEGLAQELALIGSSLRTRAEGGDAQSAMLVSAADRALAESRLAIIALSAKPPFDLVDAVRRAAEDAAHRTGVRLELELELDERVPQRRSTRELLMRAVQEGVRNAVTHGHATVVRVELRRDRALLLKLTDDGCGFDPEAHSRGFGLMMMRERAEAVGGSLLVQSAPGAGTTIELLVPSFTDGTNQSR